MNTSLKKGFGTAGVVFLIASVLLVGVLWYGYENKWFGGGTVATSTVSLPEGWKTYTDAGGIFSFNYPVVFGATVWRVTTPWPPTPKVFATTTETAILLGCPNLESPRATSTGTTKSGDSYTLYTSKGVGAGSLYDNTCALFEKGGKEYVMNILVQSHTGCGNNECGAYCGTPNEAECRAQDYTKDITEPILQVLNSFSFVK
jgi:hypothetical protein